MDSPVMTVQAAADYLKVSVDTMYVLVRAKAFPAVKVGNSWRVLRRELDEWLQEQLKEKPDNIER